MRQMYFEKRDVEMLMIALDLWSAELASEAGLSSGQRSAGRYLLARVAELRQRLSKLDQESKS